MYDPDVNYDKFWLFIYVSSPLLLEDSPAAREANVVEDRSVDASTVPSLQCHVDEFFPKLCLFLHLSVSLYV